MPTLRRALSPNKREREINQPTSGVAEGVTVTVLAAVNYNDPAATATNNENQPPIASLAPAVKSVTTAKPTSVKATSASNNAKSKRTKKDPHAPKRPKTAYHFYQQDANAQIRLEFGTTNLGEISKITSDRWKQLTEQERRVYEVKAEEDERRFFREKYFNSEGTLETAAVNDLNGANDVGKAENTVNEAADSKFAATTADAVSQFGVKSLNLTRCPPHKKIKVEKYEPRRVSNETAEPLKSVAKKASMAKDEAKEMAKSSNSTPNKTGLELQKSSEAEETNQNSPNSSNGSVSSESLLSSPSPSKKSAERKLLDFYSSKSIFSPVTKTQFNKSNAAKDVNSHVQEPFSLGYKNDNEDASPLSPVANARRILFSSGASLKQEKVAVNHQEKENALPKSRSISNTKTSLEASTKGCVNNTDKPHSPPTSSFKQTTTDNAAKVQQLRLIPLTSQQCRIKLTSKNIHPTHEYEIPNDAHCLKTLSLVSGEEVNLARNAVTGIKSSLISRCLCTVSFNDAASDETTLATDANNETQHTKPKAKVVIHKPPNMHGVHVDGIKIDDVVGSSIHVENGSIVSLYGPFGFGYEVRY